ncbi:MAG: MFS transporter [Acetobacter sp.]|uniref:MFS transporter n=1 Tax=Acetobacter sp. TaxID=440 RepID=UPI0039EA5F69
MIGTNGQVIISGSVCNDKATECRLDEIPSCRLHHFVTLSAAGGTFCDGYAVGVIGAVMPYAVGALHAGSFGSGFLGSGTLFGILAGAVITGPLADRIGRKPLLQAGMLLATVFSVLQLFVTSIPQLTLLRFALGVSLAADYVAGAVYLLEYAPLRNRGKRLSLMLVSWTVGYAVAFQLAYWFCGSGGMGWRISLALGGVPALAVYRLRRHLPESLTWLAARRRMQEAQAVARRHFAGYAVILPLAAAPTPTGGERSLKAMLWSRPVVSRMLVAFVFLTAQIVPYFCIGTFLFEILGDLGIRSGYFLGLIYTAFLVMGALLGQAIIDRMSRRVFLVGTFGITSVLLFVLASGYALSLMAQVALFSVFALTLSASCCMEYVYMAELFPVEVRTSCNGITQSASRICTSICTLVFPVMTQAHGVETVLRLTAALLGFGALYCLIFAPDTRHAHI